MTTVYFIRQIESDISVRDELTSTLTKKEFVDYLCDWGYIYWQLIIHFKDRFSTEKVL